MTFHETINGQLFHHDCCFSSPILTTHLSPNSYNCFINHYIAAYEPLYYYIIYIYYLGMISIIPYSPNSIIQHHLRPKSWHSLE